jgi:hypothetical protein
MMRRASFLRHRIIQHGGIRMLRSSLFIAAVSLGCCCAAASADVLVDQVPVTGGGTMRGSQLWQDPSGDGNDLDSDTVCWQDFVLAAPTTIDHVEWWGLGACEIGFRIEIWPQDPGTIAYQPLGVFSYGGSTNPPQPTFTIDVALASVVQTAGPGGIVHYTVDLPTPMALPANTPQNPRWFIGVIGLTAQPYAPWNWAKGTGGSTKSYRWLHGSGGPSFQVLPEGRALKLESPNAPCSADLDGNHAVDAADLAAMLGQWGSAGTADLNGSGLVDAGDLAVLLGAWGGCP